MNKKAESVKLVVILSTALVLIGIVFVSFGKETTITGKTTLAQNECYQLIDGKLNPQEVDFCCGEIRRSTGCQKYNDNLYVCANAVANKETIGSCV